MKPHRSMKSPVSLFLTALLVLCTVLAFAQQSTTAEHVAALKAILAASKAILKQYEWVETTVVSLKGAEKSRQMNRCYYGADSGVQKIPLTVAPPPEKRRGLRGRIAERKQEELTDYMKNAIALVKSYVPPTPELLQSAKDQGRVAVEILEPGKRVRLNVRGYLKPEDTLSADIDLTTNHLLALGIKTYLDDAKDVVNLKAHLAELAGGATYADQVTLDAPAKKLQVKVENSGYRKSN